LIVFLSFIRLRKLDFGYIRSTVFLKASVQLI